MEEEIKEIIIPANKEADIKLSPAFKLVLGCCIFLSGILTLVGILFFTSDKKGHKWINGINTFLSNTLFFACITLCFISLISILVTKRPFSKILIWTVFSVGLLFIVSSFVFTKIDGYECSIHILSFGGTTLFDGALLLFGLLGVLASRLIHYGLMYQINSDSTL